MKSEPLILVTHEYSPFRGGAATYAHEIALGSMRIGMEVEIWTAEYRGRAQNAQAFESLFTMYSGAEPRVVRFASSGRLTPLGLLRLGVGFWRARRTLRGSRVALLSVGAQMIFFLLDLVGAISAKRVVCCFYGSELLRFSDNRVWRWLARRFYARAAGFAACSHYAAELARNSGLLPAGAQVNVAICACSSALTAAALTANKPSPVETAATHAGADGRLRVLTVARLHPRKGQAEVARALALMPAGQREQVVYQMVGTGDASYRREIEDACAAGGVRCEFLEAIEDAALPALYASATVYAQASRTLRRSVEGFGISLLEASFHGCPIAAFDSGGVGEAVRDGETGLLVPEGDLDALARAIGALLGDPALRTKMGGAGRVFARSFDWEKSARILAAAFEGAPGSALDIEPTN